MSVNLVLVFPGQGSQKPGMAKDLYDEFAPARAAIDAAATALSTEASSSDSGHRSPDSGLERLMFDGPADELTLTHNAQPALLAHGAAVWAVIREHAQSRVRAAAGHSLGEFTAFHAAGSLALGDAVKLVRARG